MRIAKLRILKKFSNNDRSYFKNGINFDKFPINNFQTYLVEIFSFKLVSIFMPSLEGIKQALEFVEEKQRFSPSNLCSILKALFSYYELKPKVGPAESSSFLISYPEFFEGNWRQQDKLNSIASQSAFFKSQEEVESLH